MFGEKSNGIAIGGWIALREIPHCLNQQFLAFDVAFIANTRRAAALGLRHYWYGEDSGHSSDPLQDGLVRQ